MLGINKIRETLEQYNNMCTEYNRLFNSFLACSSEGKIDEVETLKRELIQLNSKITELQRLLDAFLYVPNYNREEGHDANRRTSELDDWAKKYSEHSQRMKADGESGEYKNDGLVDKRKIPIEDARKAAEAWGEGYEPLTDFLEVCIRNGVQTFSCCAGHSEQESTYVLFRANDERAMELAEFVIENRLAGTVGLFIVKDGKDVYLPIKAPMNMREKLYRECSEHIKKQDLDKREEKEPPSIIRRMAALMDQDAITTQFVYDIQTDEYSIINEDKKRVRYTRQELERELQKDPTGKSLKKKKAVIDRIKKMCSDAKIGLSEIRFTRPLNRQKSGEEDKIADK